MSSSRERRDFGLAASETTRRNRRRRLGLASVGAVASAMSVAALSLPAVAHPVTGFLPIDNVPATSTELKLLGHTSFKHAGNNGEVVVLGNTAIVAGGIQGSGGLRTHMYTPYPCVGNKIRLVNIANPAAPAQIAKINVPTGQTARDVAAIHVVATGASPTAYDLLAVAYATCNSTGSAQDRGIEFFDITTPSAPVSKGRYLADLEQFTANLVTDGPLLTTGANSLLWESNYDANFKTVSVELIAPGPNNPTIGVAVSNFGSINPPSTISVTLTTNGVGASTATAAQVRTAINANTQAKSLVFVSQNGTGAGVVNPTGPSALTLPANPCLASLDCASSQDSVSLAQMADGKVIATGTEPFAGFSSPAACENGPFTAANGVGTFPNCFFPSADLRIVDATNPTAPVQVGDFQPRRSDPAGGPPISPENPTTNGGFSKNGCRPFNGIMSAELNGDGTKAVAADMDDGLISLNPAIPAGPAVFSETPAASLVTYGDPAPAGDRDTEGNSSFATFAKNDSLALLSDQDWIGADSTVNIASTTGGPIAAGTYKGCEAHFSLFAPNNTTQVYRNAGFQLPAGAGNNGLFEYAGRGCPSDPLPKIWTDANTDGIRDPGEVQPVNLTGKIAVVDRNRSSLRFGGTGPPPVSCGASDKTVQMALQGAIAVVVDAQQAGGYSFAFDGAPAGQSIPMIAMDRPAADQLINALCTTGVTAGQVTPPPGPTSGDGVCSGATHATVMGNVKDSPPAGSRSLWGALHVMNPTTGAQVSEFRTFRSQQFPPPDLGVYSVHHAVAKPSGNRAYVAWNSDGLRVVDLATPAAPVERGHFIPFNTATPPFGDLDDANGVLPTQAYVVGVAIAGPNGAGGCNIAVTDINGGLWMVRDKFAANSGPNADC